MFFDSSVKPEQVKERLKSGRVRQRTVYNNIIGVIHVRKA